MQLNVRDDVLNSDDESTAIAYDRFFVIKPQSVEKPLHKLSLFVVEKSFKAAVGNAQNVRRLRDGKILVEHKRPPYWNSTV